MTERSIQSALKAWKKALAKKHGAPDPILIKNIYLFEWESDLLELDHFNQFIEYEIKTTKPDFKNDFYKEKHGLFRALYNSVDIPNYFYYVSPEGIIEEEEVPEYAGLIHIRQSKANSLQKYCKVIKLAPELTKETIDLERALYIIRKIVS